MPESIGEASTHCVMKRFPKYSQTFAVYLLVCLESRRSTARAMNSDIEMAAAADADEQYFDRAMEDHPALLDVLVDFLSALNRLHTAVVNIATDARYPDIGFVVFTYLSHRMLEFTTSSRSRTRQSRLSRFIRRH